MDKKIRICSAMFAGMMLFCSVSGTKIFKADAGVSDLTVGSSQELSGQSALPGSTWYTDKSDQSGTTVENGVIVFNATASDSRFNLRRKIQNIKECGVDTAVTFDASLLLTSLPDNVKFVIALGMPKVASKLEDAEAYIFLEKLGATVCFGVMKGKKEVLESSAVRGYREGTYFNVSFSISVDGVMNGKVGETEFSLEDIPTEGFLGFGQMTKGDGRVSVNIKNLNVSAYTNDTPENSDLFEDFNMNCFNMNTFNSVSKASGTKTSRLTVENGALVFDNTGPAFLATAHKYSNVDIGFDLVDVVGEMEYDEEGNVTRVRSGSFGLTFGMILNSKIDTNAQLSVEFIPTYGEKTKTSLAIKSYREVLQSVQLPEKYNIFGNKDVYSVRVSVCDGVVTVLLKNSSENGFTEMVNINVGFTPLGYFEIAALGALEASFQKGLAAEQLSVGSFTIDNLSIANKDYGKMSVVVDYRSNREPIVGDYEYVNDWSDDDLLVSTIK